MTRRRGSHPSLVTILWRDIPAQVVASGASGTHKLLLPGRFQRSIDRAAKVAGLTELDPYVAQWRRVEEPLDGDAETAAQLRVQQLDAAYHRQRLFDLVAAGGLEPQPDATAGARPTVTAPSESPSPPPVETLGGRS